MKRNLLVLLAGAQFGLLHTSRNPLLHPNSNKPDPIKHVNMWFLEIGPVTVSSKDQNCENIFGGERIKESSTLWVLVEAINLSRKKLFTITAKQSEKGTPWNKDRRNEKRIHGVREHKPEKQ